MIHYHGTKTIDALNWVSALTNTSYFPRVLCQDFSNSLLRFLSVKFSKPLLYASIVNVDLADRGWNKSLRKSCKKVIIKTFTYKKHNCYN